MRHVAGWELVLDAPSRSERHEYRGTKPAHSGELGSCYCPFAVRQPAAVAAVPLCFAPLPWCFASPGSARPARRNCAPLHLPPLLLMLLLVLMLMLLLLLLLVLLLE